MMMCQGSGVRTFLRRQDEHGVHYGICPRCGDEVELGYDSPRAGMNQSVFGFYLRTHMVEPTLADSPWIASVSDATPQD